MSDYYDDFAPVFLRIGLSSALPADPPDSQAMFWAIDTRKLYGVDSTLNWTLINPDVLYNDFHVKKGSITLSAYPDGVVFTTTKPNTFIYEVRVKVTTVWTAGVDLTIGDVGDNSRLMDSTVTDLQTLGQYTTNPLHNYVAATQIKAYLSAVPSVGVADIYFLFDEGAI